MGKTSVNSPFKPQPIRPTLNIEQYRKQLGIYYLIIYTISVNNTKVIYFHGLHFDPNIYNLLIYE